MLNNIRVWLRGAIDLALVVIALGVVLQILFGKLVFINNDVTANLINLINQFSGAGLVGAIAFGIVYYLIRKD
jgi:hypothetical protein